MHPEDWTVDFILSAGYSLTVYCLGRCRSGRDVDVLALVTAGRGPKRIAELRFTCPRCGGKGHPLVSWWAAGYSSWDYERRRLKGALPPPT